MYTLAANNDTPFKLDDAGATDRRTNIFKTSDEPILEVVDMTFDRFAQEIDSELEDFIKYLRTITLEPKRVGEIIENAARKRLIEESKDHFTIYVGGVLNRDFSEIDFFDSSTARELEKELSAKAHITARSLTDLFGKLSGKVRKALAATYGVSTHKTKKYGYDGKTVVYDFTKYYEDRGIL